MLQAQLQLNCCHKAVPVELLHRQDNKDNGIRNLLTRKGKAHQKRKCIGHGTCSLSGVGYQAWLPFFKTIENGTSWYYCRYTKSCCSEAFKTPNHNNDVCALAKIWSPLIESLTWTCDGRRIAKQGMECGSFFLFSIRNRLCFRLHLDREKMTEKKGFWEKLIPFHSFESSNMDRREKERTDRSPSSWWKFFLPKVGKKGRKQLGSQKTFLIW